MAKITVLQIIEDKKPITNGRWRVIAQKESGEIIDGWGSTKEEALADAERQAE